MIFFVTGTWGLVGFDALDQGGHLKVKRNLLICLTVLLIVPLAVFSGRNSLHWKISGLDFFELSSIPFCSLLAAILPLSLYLNRRQSKSTLQPTIPNAP
jgi:hypothetical protein